VLVTPIDAPSLAVFLFMTIRLFCRLKKDADRNDVDDEDCVDDGDVTPGGGGGGTSIPRGSGCGGTRRGGCGEELLPLHVLLVDVPVVAVVVETLSGRCMGDDVTSVAVNESACGGGGIVLRAGILPVLLRSSTVRDDCPAVVEGDGVMREKSYNLGVDN
jgi:hypothetical protein